MKWNEPTSNSEIESDFRWVKLRRILLFKCSSVAGVGEAREALLTSRIVALQLAINDRLFFINLIIVLFFKV